MAFEMKSAIKSLLLAICFSAFSIPKYAIGTGYQYGGLLGMKHIHPLSDKNNIHFALSPEFGAAVGDQRYWGSNRRHPWGLAAGFETLTSDEGFLVAAYNYYPNAFWESGWTLGVDLGVRDAGEDCYFQYCSTRTVYPALFINLGYQF